MVGLNNRVIIPNLLPIVVAIGKDIEEVVKYDPRKESSRSTTYGYGSPHFGRRRLQSIDLLSILMENKDASIDQALARTSLAENLVKLYYHFPWHNVLHNSLTKLIKTVLNYSDFPLLEAEVVLAHQLLKDRSRLLQPIIEASKDNILTFKSGDSERKCSYGFKPHFIELTQTIRQSPKQAVVELLAKEGGSCSS